MGPPFCPHDKNLVNRYAFAMTYSSAQEITGFGDALVAAVTPRRKPLFVLDMDGNILIGYNLRTGQTLPAPADAARRNIPEGSDIGALLTQGVIEPALFAEKPMDARLPEPLVAHLNRLQAEDKPFEVAILTSRSEADALRILRDSGVSAPERQTIVADSGAVLRCRGERRPVRELEGDERRFLDALPLRQEALEKAVDNCLRTQRLESDGRPRLRFEPKGIACNVHFREILAHYGATEDSTLARSLSETLEAQLTAFIGTHSPVRDGAPSFRLLHGPATLEVKLADIHKGHGLHAVVQAALDDGVHPSAVVFAGDDVCTRDAHGNPSPGTDYYAFAAAKDIEAETGIPIRTIHTLHPIDGSLHGTEPDAGKTPPADMVQADVTVPSPLVLGELVETVLGRCAAIDRMARRGASHSVASGAPPAR